jgi:hypothetical protein
VFKIAGREEQLIAALRVAEGMGLLSGPNTKQLNAKTSQKFCEAVATEDELGPWLATNWGRLSDTSPELLDQIDL